MFLFDPTTGTNADRVQEQLKRLMERADGELLRTKKWDERRLTYEIEKRKRGVYVLAYFRAPTDKIVGMEQDVQLSEDILRVLILCRDHLTNEQVNEIMDKAEAYIPPPHPHYGEGYGHRDYAPRGEYTPRGEGYRPHGDRGAEDILDIPEIEEGPDEIVAGK